MISIDEAILKSKNMENSSHGGSECFDFGDSVLVRYIEEIEYLKDGKRARGEAEDIMEAINKKADKGVNTPRHLAVKREVEGNMDVCYVLQEKCPGLNGRVIALRDVKNGISYSEAIETLEKIANYPFEHYKKLVSDSCELFEMGYEGKDKNMFYDSNSGFWFIDFLENNTDYIFDSNDIFKVFELVKERMFKPITLCPFLFYNLRLSSEEEKNFNKLKYSIKAKTFLAIKEVLPIFSRYEKFYLLKEEEGFKHYLMDNNVVSYDLFSVTKEDYDLFNELYLTVLDKLLYRIIDKGEKFWSVECNDIRNDSALFNLETFFSMSDLSGLKPSYFEDEYDYSFECSRVYNKRVLKDLMAKLENLRENQNVSSFLEDAYASKKL